MRVESVKCRQIFGGEGGQMAYPLCKVNRSGKPAAEHGVEGRRLPACGFLSYSLSLEIYGLRSGLWEQFLRIVSMLSHSSEYQ